MTSRTLIARNLRFHLRSHLGVVTGAAIASTALIGALVVGDSMRQSLKQRALARLGWVHFALAPQDRFFSDRIVESFKPGAGQPTALALRLPGTVSRQDGSARANQVNVIGVDARFWGTNATLSQIPSNSVVLNHALAAQLRVTAGDEVMVRSQKPAGLSRELAITAHNEETLAVRCKVVRVLPEQSMGDFDLRADPGVPLNAFVSLAEFSDGLGLHGKANLLLKGSGPRILNEDLHHLTSVADLGLQLTNLTPQGSVELRSDRIFLEPEILRAIHELETNNVPASMYSDAKGRGGLVSTSFLGPRVGTCRPHPGLGASLRNSHLPGEPDSVRVERHPLLDGHCRWSALQHA